MRKDATVLCFALLVAIVVLSGCTSLGSTAAAAPAPTRQLRAQDPIMGVWRYSSSTGFDTRIRFNSDGTCVESVADEKGTSITPGTWIAQGKNSYVEHMTGIWGSHTWIFSPDRNGIYLTNIPDVLFTPYQGDVAELAFTLPRVSKDGIPDRVMLQLY